MRVLLFVTAVVMLCSCKYLGGKRISGNGNVVTRQINTSTFHSIHVMGAVDVKLKQNNQSSVRVETDENLFEYLDVYTDGNTLIVKKRKGYNLDPTKKLVVYAAAPAFREIKVSGSGDIFSENTITGSEPLMVDVSGSGDINMQVNVPAIATHISGSGSVALRGNARQYVASVDGSGEIKSFDLSTENTEVKLSGSADAQVNASKNLQVKISGSGSVQYRGNPAVKQKISGSGSVERVG